MVARQPDLLFDCSQVHGIQLLRFSLNAGTAEHPQCIMGVSVVNHSSFCHNLTIDHQVNDTTIFQYSSINVCALQPLMQEFISLRVLFV